ncbi:MAG: tetratricopeptide repeat protein [Treponema phagedenis]|uniref:tetratricopeptide repeat protein n=1 Tax=Treponema phagedenis TaxID=162 RepID=UPI003133F060
MSENVERLLHRVKSALLSRDFDFGEKILKGFLESNKNLEKQDEYEIYSALGQLYLRSEQFQKALSVYKKLQMQNAQDADVLNNLGTVYRRLGKLPESVAILKTALKLGKNKETVLYNLGNTYKEGEVYDRAADCFKQVLELNPNDVLAYNHLGTIQALEKKTELAIETYYKGLLLDPNHPFLHFNLANIFYKQGKLTAALESYLEAVKTMPGFIEAQKNIADIYLKIGKTDLALHSYKTLIQIEGESDKNLTALGTLYAQKGFKKESKIYYTQALKINNKFAPAAVGIAEILIAEKKYLEALHALEVAGGTASKVKELLVTMTEVCLKLRDYAKAKEVVLHFDPEWDNDIAALKVKGTLFSLLGDSEKASEAFKKILEIAPSQIDFRLELAEQYFLSHQYEEAKEELVQYLKNKPGDIPIRMRLAEILETMEKPKAAYDEYKKILQEDANHIEANRAIAALMKKYGELESAIHLAGEIANIQSSGDIENSVASFSQTLDLYEKAAQAFEKDVGLNANIDFSNDDDEQFFDADNIEIQNLPTYKNEDIISLFDEEDEDTSSFPYEALIEDEDGENYELDLSIDSPLYDISDSSDNSEDSELSDIPEEEMGNPFEYDQKENIFSGSDTDNNDTVSDFEEENGSHHFETDRDSEAPLLSPDNLIDNSENLGEAEFEPFYEQSPEKNQQKNKEDFLTDNNFLGEADADLIPFDDKDIFNQDLSNQELKGKEKSTSSKHSDADDTISESQKNAADPASKKTPALPPHTNHQENPLQDFPFSPYFDPVQKANTAFAKAAETLEKLANKLNDKIDSLQFSNDKKNAFDFPKTENRPKPPQPDFADTDSNLISNYDFANTNEDEIDLSEPEKPIEESPSEDITESTEYNDEFDPQDITDEIDLSEPEKPIEESLSEDITESTEYNDEFDPQDTTEEIDLSEPEELLEESPSENITKSTEYSNEFDPQDTTEEIDLSEPEELLEESPSEDITENTEYSNEFDPQDITEEIDLSEPEKPIEESLSEDRPIEDEESEDEFATVKNKENIEEFDTIEITDDKPESSDLSTHFDTQRFAQVSHLIDAKDLLNLLSYLNASILSSTEVEPMSFLEGNDQAQLDYIMNKLKRIGGLKNRALLSKIHQNFKTIYGNEMESFNDMFKYFYRLTVEFSDRILAAECIRSLDILMKKFQMLKEIE